MRSDADITKFEALFREQYAPLSRYVLGLSGSMEDTVEIVQESFLRLWSMGAAHAAEHDRPALLFRLARNLVIDMLRRRNVRERHDERAGKVIPMPQTPEQVALGRENRRLARAALLQLEPKQREILRLRLAGFSYAEISRILELNRESIGPTLTRALRRFREVHEQLTNKVDPGGRNENAG
ncbi:MAG: sigma-70 family RNA polymerase sigma factor [Acidobacteria bacterium]|nr:sigma-70 family RNA polymerase sigma factor [Acidobacteriota bacterium]